MNNLPQEKHGKNMHPDTFPKNTEKHTHENLQKSSTYKQSLWEFFKFLIIAIIIVIPIRVWVAQPFIVSGSSMVPNFEDGDYLIVDEFSYYFREPERGEVIIFRYPNDPSKFFIKRIVGLPGEKIEIEHNEIKVYNELFPAGILITENYLKDTMATADIDFDLEADEYFVMGDNRKQSSDSRIWGPLKKNLLIGRAWLRLWPFNKFSISF